MAQMPEFWRTEVWHPLSTHFPIALLLVATLFKGVAIFSNKEVWHQGGSILLFLGFIGAWVAVQTGNMADNIVARQICDPTVLKDHENSAYMAAWLFTAAVGLDLVHHLGLQTFKKFLKVPMVILMLIGSGFLIYTGHLGTTLVYQQGAGVYKPGKDCHEFN